MPTSDAQRSIAKFLKAEPDELFGERPSPAAVLDHVFDQWRARRGETLSLADTGSVSGTEDAEARDRYYEGQDAATYSLWKVQLPDGRELIERPPEWFRDTMREARKR